MPDFSSICISRLLILLFISPFPVMVPFFRPLNAVASSLYETTRVSGSSASNTFLAFPSYSSFLSLMSAPPGYFVYRHILSIYLPHSLRFPTFPAWPAISANKKRQRRLDIVRRLCLLLEYYTIFLAFCQLCAAAICRTCEPRFRNRGILLHKEHLSAKLLP